MIIHSYNTGHGVRELKNLLTEKGQSVIVTRKEPRGRSPFIIGWGSRPIEYPPRQGMTILNHPIFANAISDKLKFFRRINVSPSIPLWTTSQSEASSFETVCIRRTTGGSGGDGLEIVDGNQLASTRPAPLYVQYQKKTSEFRLHIFRGREDFEIRHVQKKIAQNKERVLNWQIRNLENGFTYVQGGFTVPESVTRAALDVMGSFPDIDFVALDVIYHEPSDRAYVLEGNTAPGLQGRTVGVYADYFIERNRN